MTIWKCKQCARHCTFERDTVFVPERCVYNDRVNSVPARWVKDDGN